MPERGEPVKTLVRGPDGALWLLSEQDAPMKLSEEQKEKAEKLIHEFEEKLSDEVIEPGVHACVGVHLGLSMVFGRH